MKNIAASVRARLLQEAKAQGLSLDNLIERFAIERLLWRLSQSSYSDQFILKGAQLFTLWHGEIHRPTRDLDLLGFGDSSITSVSNVFSKILNNPIAEDDGIEWGLVKTKLIREEQFYGGVRVETSATIFQARVNVQVDIGFGDSVSPAPIEKQWPALLDFPAPILRAYPPETVIAEKLHAAVELDFRNSRMKDFFDLHWLQENQSFEMKTLRAAVSATFERRETQFPTSLPLALTEEFSSEPTKQTQWKAFLRKGKLENRSLEEVIQQLRKFLEPVLFAPPEAQNLIWKPDDGWHKKRS